jgi:hypothetical protein
MVDSVRDMVLSSVRHHTQPERPAEHQREGSRWDAAILFADGGIVLKQEREPVSQSFNDCSLLFPVAVVRLDTVISIHKPYQKANLAHEEFLQTLVLHLSPARSSSGARPDGLY